MEIKRFRILEWTSEFAGRSPRVEYELQSQTAVAPVRWETLGTSPTLERHVKRFSFTRPIVVAD